MISTLPSSEADICCLCGTKSTKENPITREHVPPKQFFPKSLRPGLNLWVVPTHKSCNGSYKSDEEYFFHAFYPLVGNANPQMASVLLEDLQRRAKNLQTPTLIRSILRTRRTTTEGGVILPPEIVALDVDAYRVQQVAVKIGRCLFYRDHNRFVPIENCRDIRLCQGEEDVPEVYRLSWELSKTNIEEAVPIDPVGTVVIVDAEAGQAATPCQNVFSYRRACVDGMHLYSLMFWQALMFCMTFTDPM